MREIWKKINGYGDYEVSNFGAIKSFKYEKINGSIMHPAPTKKGYLRIKLGDGKISKTFSVHRLVCENFLPNDEDEKIINHKNGLKYDNRLENLEWVTHSENVRHSFNELGRVAGRKKQVIQYDKNNNLVREWEAISDASNALNISPSSISQCCTKIRKSCGGFIWKFLDATNA